MGGSLGREKEEMYEVVRWSLEPAPDAAPRHLLGIGDVDDLLAGVGAGIDMFDCAIPTRLGRHGTALVADPDNRWRLDLTKQAWAESRDPIAPDCPCPACREHTRGYLHYLARIGELTAARLLTLHNLTFIAAFMSGMRAAIVDGTFDDYSRGILAGASPY